MLSDYKVKAERGGLGHGGRLPISIHLPAGFPAFERTETAGRIPLAASAGRFS